MPSQKTHFHKCLLITNGDFMSKLQNIINELDELFIVNNVTGIHDDIRNQYPRRRLKVYSDEEFDDMIADYYNFHFTRCVSFGGQLTKSEAAGRAKEIIANALSEEGMNIIHAYYNGKNGLHGGMNKILDIISETLKMEARERHVRSVLDKYIPQSNWEEKVSIMKEILQTIPGQANYIEKNQPERYAHDYERFVRSVINYINSKGKQLRNY